jgi:hypothetical protein
VADAERARQCPVGQCGVEVGQLAGPALDGQSTVRSEYGDAGRVVTAVFEPA